MTQADSVHSTPPINTSAIDDAQSPAIPAATAEPSRDLAYRRLEDRICDLDRLCEVAHDYAAQAIESPDRPRLAELAVVTIEIVQDRMRELKATYYDWYKSPPKDGNQDPWPSYVRE
jgi:hypothetical protein